MSELSPRYRPLLKQSVAMQAVLVLASALAMDRGASIVGAGAGLTLFWIVVLFLVRRHPQAPSRIDVFIIRFGPIALVLLGWIAGQMLTGLRR